LGDSGNVQSEGWLFLLCIGSLCSYSLVLIANGWLLCVSLVLIGIMAISGNWWLWFHCLLCMDYGGIMHVWFKLHHQWWNLGFCIMVSLQHFIGLYNEKAWNRASLFNLGKKDLCICLLRQLQMMDSGWNFIVIYYG